MRVALLAPAMAVADAFCRNSEHLFELSGANTGNFAFTHALFRHFSPGVERFFWHERPEVIRERCQIAVVACANQLGPHTDMSALAHTLEKTGLPIVALGLGAQAPDTSASVSLTAGTDRWLRVLADHAPAKGPNIGVRGAFTLQVLEKLGLEGQGAVIGCPSNFLSEDPDLGAKIAAKYAGSPIERVAVAAGTRHAPAMAPLEQELARLATSTGGVYVTQADLDMIRLARSEFDAIDPGDLEKLRAYIRPDLDIAAFKRWCRRYATCFTDSGSWLEAMRAFDFVVGPRFHGVMQAIQAGTPGGVVVHDSRTRELCETMRIPFRDYREIEPGFRADELYRLFPFDADAYRVRRRELLLRYLGVLSWAGVKPSKALLELEAETAQAERSPDAPEFAPR